MPVSISAQESSGHQDRQHARHRPGERLLRAGSKRSLTALTTVAAPFPRAFLIPLLRPARLARRREDCLSSRFPSFKARSIASTRARCSLSRRYLPHRCLGSAAGKFLQASIGRGRTLFDGSSAMAASLAQHENVEKAQWLRTPRNPLTRRRMTSPASGDGAAAIAHRPGERQLGAFDRLLQIHLSRAPPRRWRFEP
jgi:hypothetical protein